MTKTEGRKVKIIAGIILFLAVMAGVYFLKTVAVRTDLSKVSSSDPKILNVDEVVNHPERFTGPIGVIGTVTKVDKASATFYLGCEDACIMMPAKYKGQMPKVGSKVTIYGEIKRTEGKRYIFEAKKVIAK